MAGVDARLVAAGRPVRRVRNHRGSRNYAGSDWSSTNGGHVGYESLLELNRLWLAAFDYLAGAGTLPIHGPLTWRPYHVDNPDPADADPDDAAEPEPRPGLAPLNGTQHVLDLALLIAGDQPGPLTDQPPHQWARDAIHATGAPEVDRLATQHAEHLARQYLQNTPRLLSADELLAIPAKERDR